ncbi:GAD-like domain-containing protein [Pseudomonas sp. Teo4]|uniref:GAD-like domain-containing protein n=1 Tax=Pseudomonas sp. Teo4 TaxID=3064528 RepID=UPI002ABC4A3A|nr:GAD-like domain-containing protein [Pseudomonas sp. Teo4]MDZ3993042.1 hypothetical protein [Pseudomonas sp. Teo4]
MDVIFSIFQETFDNPIGTQQVPLPIIENYQGKLPNQLITYWKEHGWRGYGSGLFWMVNPQEYEEVVAHWLSGTHFETRDTYHLIARSAFGDLYLWGEHTGSLLTIAAYHSRYIDGAYSSSAEDMDGKIQALLMWVMTESINFNDLFKPAREALGDLASDEMYGFVPALMLGGSGTLKHLEKLKAVEHLIILSQFTDLLPYEFSDDE